MTLTLALVEILLSPYPESLQSTQNIFDVADAPNSPVGNGGNGAAPESLTLLPPSQESLALPDSPVSGNEGVGGTVDGHGRATNEYSVDSEVVNVPADECALSVGRSENQASPADSPISDRFGDDRFTDNILRACRNLPQHGDDEEERDAAEEGALIEASGYQDPKFESNGR